MKKPDVHRSVEFASLIAHASRRYRTSGFAAWKFARVKLRTDLVYRMVLEGPWLSGGPLLDLGCGQGLMLAVIVAARELQGRGASAENEEVRRLPERLVGIETRARVARIAAKALGCDAEILSADARGTPFPSSQTILIFDVLHLMPEADQDRLLDRLLEALKPGGCLLLREADRSAGWKFQFVRFSNSAKAVLGRKSLAQFHFRTASQWRDLLRERGLSVEVRPTDKGTPFGNVLLAGRKEK